MLPFSAALSLASRNVGRNKTRSVLALAAITTGLVGVILAGGFVEDLLFRLGEAVIRSQSGHLQIARSGYFDLGSRSPSKFLIASEELESLQRAEIPHVTRTMRRISFSGLLSNGRASYPIGGEGIQAEPEAALGTFTVLQSGSYLSSRDRYGVMVGAGVARALDLQIGNVVSLLAPTVDEAMNSVELEVIGVFQSFSKDYDDRVIKISLETAQELLNTQGVNVLVMLLDDTRNTDLVARGLPDRAGYRGLELRTWVQLNDFYGKTVALYDRQFGVMKLIVLLMVVLSVVGAINVAVLERQGEFGTMRALGNKRRDVALLVLSEAALLAAIGATLGLILGIGVAWFISEVGIAMPPPPNSNLQFTAQIRLTPGLLAEAFLLGVIATMIASFPPAIRVLRVPLVDALRHTV